MSKFLLLLCVIIFASCEAKKKNSTTKITQSEQPDNSVFEQQVDSLRLAYQIPGISIGISINDSIHLIRGFGMANIEEEIPMTGNTPLRIASLTKPIFSTILM
jgi:CubicO group peptidase (beta-lactamase class C family)